MKTDYFTFLDISAALIWLVVFLVIGIFIKTANNDKPEYRYYLPNLYFKLMFSLAFALFYILIGGGGDTVAYYDGAVKLNNLFFKSPLMYFEEILYEPDTVRFHTFYDATTGYPPGWIYKESEAFFVSKLMSFLSFFTLKSYFAMTFIMAYLTAVASWKLFKFVKSYNICNERLLAIGILLLPSVNFWCAGVSKDTVVFICIIYLVIHAFKIISNDKKTSFFNVVMVIVYGYILLHVRSFIFLALLIPITFAYSSKLIRFLGGGEVLVTIFKTVVFVGGVGITGVLLFTQSQENILASNELVQEAVLTQNDFSENTTYGEKKYDLGEVEFTPIGLIRVMPLVVVTGTYRPFLWEALGPTLILNGLESFFLLYLTFLFVRRKFFKKIKVIGRHELLLFCILFVFFIAFMTGLTSILYGVLVRLRAPLLPFLFVILSIDWKQIDLDQLKTKRVEGST